VLWCWFLAAAHGISLRSTSLLSLGIAVWILYALDRLLDARKGHALQERHLFHHRHHISFTAGILISGIVLAVLLPRVLADVRGGWLLLTAPLAAHLTLIHRFGKHRRKPKEIVVAAFFTAACTLPAALRVHHSSTLLPDLLFFGVVCWLNCIAIARWEPPSPDAHPTTLWGRKHLPVLCLLTAGLAIAIAFFLSAPLPEIACALSATLLFVFDRYRRQLLPLTLRTLADAALATPLLLAYLAWLTSHRG